MKPRKPKFSGLKKPSERAAEEQAARDATSIQDAVEETIDGHVSSLTPTKRMIFDRVRPLISDALRDRITARKATFILIRVPGPDWRSPIFDAVTTAIEDAVRTDNIVFAQFNRIPRDSYEVRSWERKKTLERTDAAMAMLSSGITIVALAPGEDLDPSVTAIADLTVDLTAFTVADMRGVIARAFPGEDIHLPDDFALSDIDTRWLDLAIGRSLNAQEVVDLVTATLGRDKGGSSHPRLEDLHGYGEAKVWGLRLANALREYRDGKQSWADVDAGALFVGPPGTGKTLYASALAQSCGITFIATSYSAWQSEGEGHLGTVTKAIRKVFSDAATAAPCIVFIDEIDTLPARGSTSRHDDWWRSLTNCLLECLDGTGRREGVIVIAACNDDSRLDPALVRSGRLDRRFYVGLPSEDDLQKILSHHLPTIPEDEIQPAAVMLAGSTTGADAARIARDVRQLAIGENREPDAADLLTVALPPDDRSPRIRRRIAVHEAGHAVAVLRQGRIPTSLSIATASGGHVIHENAMTEALLEDLNERLAIMLAGRAAEEIVLGNVSAGAGGPDTSDLGSATRLVSLVEGRFGLGLRLRVVDAIDEALVERRLRIAYAEALFAAIRDRTLIERLAGLASERRVLGRAALAEFWSENSEPPFTDP